MKSRYLLLAAAIISRVVCASEIDSAHSAEPPDAQQQLPDEQEQTQPGLDVAPANELPLPPQSWEPAPSPLAFASLWDRLRNGFAIPNLDSAMVREWEQYYAAHPETLYRISERGRRYMYHIVEELEKRNMPLDLALLPMIESAYNPRAYSPAHAAGIWQFVPSTGKHYGLEQTWWYDGRRDVLAATEAALDYLNYLYGLFGDWHLALASYNWGEGAVSRALAKNRARQLPEDYSSIGMPAETLNYVPKLLAVRNLIANPEAYGLKLPAIPNRPYFSVVDAPHHMDTQIAARLAGMTIDEFTNLNPAFNKPIIAYKPSRKLLVPADRASEFSERLASFDGQLLSWQPYTTTAGESYDRIASRFGTTLARLREVNNIGKSRAARGETLMVPRSEEILAGQEPENTEPSVTPEQDYAPTTTSIPSYTRLEKVEPLHTKKHTVRKGDTVYSISRRYDLSVPELLSLNKLRSSNLRLGQPLRVAKLSALSSPDKSANQAPPQGKRPRTGKWAGVEKRDQVIHYVTRRGDTIFSIARKHRVSVNDLQNWNKLGKRPLQAGQSLRIAPD